MAVSGPLPNPDRSQVRHANPVHEWTEVDDVPFEGHLLPDRYAVVRGELRTTWPPPAVRWWNAIRRMPHARLWTPADWERAFGTAELVARFHEGESARATEIRLRESEMGVTIEDRRKLRIRYVKPSTASEREQEAGRDPRAGNVVQVDFGSMYGA